MTPGHDESGAAGPPGARLSRREDRLFLAGAGRYLADLSMTDALEVCFVRSERARARIVGIDTVRAACVPGVVAILTAADLPAAELVDELQAVVPGLRATPQPVLARHEVRFVGQALALVVATDRYRAEDAAELVRVEYEDQPQAVDACVYDETATFGDVEAALATAAYITRTRFDTSRCSASPLETRGFIASYDSRSGRLNVWSSTQSEFVLRRRLAAVTGLPEARIRVRVPDVGGAFGQKIPIHPEEAAIAMAAIRLRRCLRWVEDRLENLLAAPHAKQQSLELCLATDEVGNFLALRADIVGDIGAYSFNSASGLIEPYVAAKYLPGPYRVQNYEYRVRAMLTNKSPVAPFRGTGGTAAMTSLEVLIETHAQQMGADPIALRRLNLSSRSDFPFVGVGGKQFDSGSHVEALDRAVELLDLEQVRRRQRVERAQGRYRGVGVCVAIESTGRPVVARWYGSYDAARITLAIDGSLTLHLAVSAQGQGHHTSLAQVAAEVLGVSPDDITVLSGDTDSSPLSVYGTRASRTAVMSGNAVFRAAQELSDRILQAAAIMTGLPKEDLTLSDGAVAKASGGVLMTLAELARRAHLDPLAREDGWLPELSVTKGYDAPITYSNACYAVEVEVDSGTGRVQVERVIAVEDCGRVINPLIVDGQVRGAVVQGIGAALLEELCYGEEGQIVTTTLMDYSLPRSRDVPYIDVHHLYSKATTNELGIKGVGESGAIGAPAAIAAAVQDALAPFGAKVEALPLNQKRVLAMLRKRGTDPGSVPEPDNGSDTRN